MLIVTLIRRRELYIWSYLSWERVNKQPNYILMYILQQ